MIPKIKLLREDSIAPTKAHYGDAGFDVYALEDKLIWPQRAHKFPLGFAIQLTGSFFAMIQEKSGLAANKYIYTIGNIIDSNYRGEVHAIVYNGSECDRIQFKRGDKIAQMIIIPCYIGDIIEIVSELDDTNRGVGGFGSTGR